MTHSTTSAACPAADLELVLARAPEPERAAESLEWQIDWKVKPGIFRLLPNDSAFLSSH